MRRRAGSPRSGIVAARPRRWAGCGAVLLVGAALVGCGEEPERGSASGAGVERGAPTGEPAPGVVNRFCPVYPDQRVADPLTSDLIVTWRGRRIGMCCDECVIEWERLWDDAAHAEAVGKMNDRLASGDDPPDE